jgi:hypothetical protein
MNLKRKKIVKSLLGGDRLPEQVNHPPHYTASKYEVIDVLEEWFPDDPHLFTIVKYLARCYLKDNPLTNLRKAEWYLQRKIQLEEKRESTLHSSNKA